VLWLYEDNDAVPINLYREAERRGVNPARLIFAKRMPLSEHLSRHSAADLFLDTFPCNAHTTASDALWAGLPILTRQGEAFASRVASSLLHSVGLSDLVVNEQSEYEKLAIKLAETPALLNKYRQALQENLLKSPLFDTKSYAKNLESLYESLFKSELN
jgi:predicted O-linked N-acetylglucosamine transferase (SPINDLY family)